MMSGTSGSEVACVPGETAEVAKRASASRRALEQVEREAASWFVRDFAGAMLAIHPPDALPARRAFDPVEVPKLLPHLILVTVERNPYRFFVKLVGQSMRDAIKTNLTGHYLQDFLEAVPSMRFPIEDRIQVCETGLAVYGLRQPRTQIAFDFARIEYLHMPFASDGYQVDQILSLFAYEGENRSAFDR
ncbi:MAG: hypothetical protein ACTS10_11390 [Kiloniellales bacterium]